MTKNKIVNSRKTKLETSIKALAGGEYMSQEQQASFREFLLGDLEEIRESELKTLEEFSSEDNRSSDEATLGSNNEALAIRHSNALQLKIKRVSINKALEAMRNDEYGYCAQCGAEIGLPRMLSVPHATLDTECATLLELKNKQEGRR